MIVYASETEENTQVGFISIPSRKVIAERDFREVFNVRFEWHESGSHLAAIALRRVKKYFANEVLIFNTRIRNVPVSMIEHSTAIKSIAWNK